MIGGILLGVASTPWLTPGRVRGRGDRGRRGEVRQLSSLVCSLSLVVSSSDLTLRNLHCSVWGVSTATMSVCNQSQVRAATRKE